MSATKHENLHLPDGANDFPDHWKWERLEDACNGIFDCHHSTPKLTDEGPFVIRTQDIITGVLNLNNAGRVSEEMYQERISRAEPNYGDILYSREGTYFGIAAEVPPNTRLCLGQRMVLIRPNQTQLHSRFATYWLNSSIMSRHIHGFRDGSVAEHLNMSTIRALPVPIPPLPEQHAIAHILGALADKIELNRRMNETLEAIARALFKSWFVDFDPVHYKARGEQPPGMDAETAALFPDSFEESELGLIPAGWRVSRLSEVCDYIMSGGTPSTQVSDYWDGSIPWLSSGETRNRFIVSTEKTITELGVEQSSTRLARDWTTVIASAGQGHTRGQASLLMFESYINQSVVALAADGGILSDLYLFFNLSGRYEELRRISDSHSSRGSLTTRLLSDLWILQPPGELIAPFDKLTKPIVEQISQTMLQSGTLAETRDALLPKLVSGELRVGEVET